jgi:HK97 family phage portal protein
MFWRRGGGSEVRKGEQGYGPGESYTPVTFDSAMQVSAYWASARLLTETVAAMPLRCFKVEDGRRTIDGSHPLFRLINRRPNRYQTRIEFFESLMLNLVTSGNAYCLINRLGNRIVSLMPITATQMKPHLLEDGSIEYHFSDINNKQWRYSADQIWHVKLFGNGITGLSPLQYAARSIDSAIVQEKRSAKYSKTGGKVGGYIETPPGMGLKSEQKDKVKQELSAMVSGDGDFLPILEFGCKFVPTSLNPADVKLMESRRFSVEDIARFMGVPSVLINDTAGSTVWGSGIGQLVEGFYKLNLRPYLERIEASMMLHLMPERDYDSYSLEFDFDSLLRADLATRLNTNSIAINSCQMTPDEARASEGRPPLAGGDKLYLNSTLIPASVAQNNRGATNEEI